MAPLGELAKRFEKLVTDNSPSILTAIGVTGALTTAYLTGKASFKAADMIMDDEFKGEMADNSKQIRKDRIRLVWKFYIPAAVSATLTVAAIISANRIGSRRAAALAVAYSVSERAFEEYRNKVVQRLGDKKEQSLRDEIAVERINRDPVDNKMVIITGRGSVLCYEEFTGRYFNSDMEALRKAQNDINEQVINDSYAALSDLYTLLGLPQTTNSDEVGWNLDRLLKLTYSYAGAEDGTPCISVGFSVFPVRFYNRLS
jgi:hypothetical protein